MQYQEYSKVVLPTGALADQTADIFRANDNIQELVKNVILI